MNSKLRKNQQGFHVLELALIIGVIIVIGLAGLYILKKNSGPKLTAAQKVVQTECVKVYSDKNDKKYCDFEALISLANTSYTMTVKTSNSSGSVNSTIKSDGKGNLSMDIPSLGAAIRYNGETYIKSPTDPTWFKFSAGSSTAQAVTNPADDFKADFKAKAAKHVKFNYIGTVACGSLTCYKYQEVDPTKAGTTQSFWFDTKDYQLRGATIKESTTTNDLTVIYGPVTITPPASSVTAG